MRKSTVSRADASRATSFCRPIRRTANRASALLLVLWAVVFAAMMVIGVVTLVRSGQEDSAALAQMFQARQIARSAVVLATHPDVSEGDPILSGTSALGGIYEVTLQSEGARININEILKKGNREVLLRLFEGWGVQDSDASVAVDSLLDWVDADPHSRLNGAERDYYQKISPDTRFPFDREFATVEEMAFVRGMDAIIACKADWENAFTVWSEGPLDLNDAAPALIAAVCDISEARTGQLVDVRSRMKTMEDPKAKRWDKTDEPLRLLGLSAEEIQKFQADVTANSSIWRAESTGTIGSKNVTVTFIFNKGKGQAGVLHRLEQ